MNEMEVGLFLDDIRNPEDVTWVPLPLSKYRWKIVRSFDDFKRAIDTLGEKIGFISYDHDLADFHYSEMNGNLVFDYDAYTGELTGYHCAKYAKKTFKENHPPYLVHSWNPVGKKNIENVLN